ncbi:MAG: tRNA uridine-5-carboxymethylaminomethyl(34) synthesis GTPase MnmE [Cyanobacteria bacterium P01_H01_bin.74]
MPLPSIATEDTIAAIATARGQAAVAIIRVSGDAALEVAYAIFQNKQSMTKTLKPGRFYTGWIHDENNTPIDHVLVLVFASPKSYTGEDVIEIHCHGGDVLAQKILARCIAVGCRYAEPGEYTLRAFLNGKMDLTQAESVMDLISSGSSRLLRQASDNIQNRSLGTYLDTMAHGLMALQAQMVASIDFPDEVEEPKREVIAVQLENCLTQMGHLRENAEKSRIVREGIKVAILGMPNSGKSSLFNALLATERSIVTQEAGTTRDVVSEVLDIDGIAVTLIDTAGIRETQESIEIMGIERSWKAASEAHIVLYLVDASVGVLRYDTQILSKLDPGSTIAVGNKKDLMLDHQKKYGGWVYLSVKTQEGIPDLLNALKSKIQTLSPEESGVILALNERQIACCIAMEEKLQEAKEALDSELPLDLVTLPLTQSLKKLDELQGRDTTEDVLGEVFARFCVGK